jgi:hypothetical protein
MRALAARLSDLWVPYELNAGVWSVGKQGLRRFAGKALLIVVAWALLLVLNGCQALKATGGPDMPFSVDDDLTAIIGTAKIGSVEKLYSDANGDEAKQRKARDDFVMARLAVVDLKYLKFIGSLTANKHELDAATDISTLTLNIAGTLTGGLQAKTNLAAAAAAITGSKASVDKNFFYEKSVDALVATMNAQRKEKLVSILHSLEGDTASYPLAAAIRDTHDYYQVGTLQGAVTAIQNDASKRDSAAQQNLNSLQIVRNIDKNLAPTDQDQKRNLTLSIDPKTLSLEQLGKALTGLGVAPADVPATVEDAAKMLQGTVRNARTGEEIARVKKAFTDAKILK